MLYTKPKLIVQGSSADVIQQTQKGCCWFQEGVNPPTYCTQFAYEADE